MELKSFVFLGLQLNRNLLFSLTTIVLIFVDLLQAALLFTLVENLLRGVNWLYSHTTCSILYVLPYAPTQMCSVSVMFTNVTLINSTIES